MKKIVAFLVVAAATFLCGLVGCAVHQVPVFNGSASTRQTKPTLDVRDFSGASVGTQIDNACTSLGGSAGVVSIPSTVGSGNSIIGVPPLCTIWDTRPFNAWPHVVEPTGHGFMLGYTAPSTQGTPPQGYSTLGLLFRNPSGALNSYSLGKNIGQALDITYTSNTATQDYPIVVTGYKEGNGDFLGGNVLAQHNGNCTAQGDECTKGWKVQAGQGNSVETPTVSAYNGSTHVLTISGISNPNTLNFGASRLILDTVAGKMYTTGTVTSIGGGTNPTVTLAGGANLNSVPGVSTLPQSGTGYCFSQSADDNPSYSGVHYVVPILEFLTSTTLSLNLTAQGQANIYPGLLTGSATLRIYQCATIQDSALSSATTIQTDGSTSAFAATDTLEIPVGWAQAMTGEHIVVSASLPQMFNNVSELITPGVYSSQIWNVLSGYVAQGFLFQNNWCSHRTASSCIPTSQPFMEFQHTPSRIMVQTDVTPPDNYTLYNIFDPVENSTFTHISSTQDPLSGPYFSWHVNGYFFNMQGGDRFFQTNLGWKAIATQAMGAQAGTSVIWADSTTHRFMMNNNNGGTDTLGDTLVQNCGTTTTCSHTNLLKPQFVEGRAALVFGSPSTATVTGFSPAFTSSTSFVCTATNATTQADPIKVVNASASSITITGPNSVTDTVNYICVGN